MFRIYELLNGKFRDISPAGGYPTEAAAIAAARTGYREHLVIVIGEGKLVGAIMAARKVSERQRSIGRVKRAYMDNHTCDELTHSCLTNFQHSSVVTALSHAPATQFLTGPAGSGKTFEVKRRILQDPAYGIVCATTGIAAVNLDGITINSLLGYFDTPDMRDKYTGGQLAAALAQLRKSGAQNLILDEVSMLDARHLDILHKAAQDSSRLPGVAAAGGPIGIVLTGDFCQLPP